MNRQQFNAMVAQYSIENISGSDVVAWSSGVPCNVQSMKFYGKCEQSTTPTPDAPVEIKCNGGSYRYTSTGDSFDITIPELRGIGEYKDEWDYVTGKGIRRIGERVLKGTEGWTKYHWGDGQGFYSYRLEIKSFNTSGEKCICTHYAPLSDFANLFYGRVEGAYVGTVNDGKAWLVIGTALPTLAEFKAFLAEQYANGTPVTVYYAMAEPQEFYEAGGSLSNLSGRIEPKNVPVTGVDLKTKCVNHSILSGDKKIVTVSGTDYVEWSGGEIYRNLPSLKFFGKSMQYSIPTPDTPTDITDAVGVFVSDSNGEYITTPNLRGIGDYKDEWDYVTGKGLRYIHKVELDGVSDYKKAIGCTFHSNSGNYFATIRLEYTSYHARFGLLLSTHFKSEWAISLGNMYVSGSGDWSKRLLYLTNTDQTLDTVDKWNNWLKEQYDNGTPVTIYYALAEPIPFEERPSTYVPIPNDSGNIWWGDGTMGFPYQVTYITHS